MEPDKPAWEKDAWVPRLLWVAAWAMLLVGTVGAWGISRAVETEGLSAATALALLALVILATLVAFALMAALAVITEDLREIRRSTAGSSKKEQ